MPAVPPPPRRRQPVQAPDAGGQEIVIAVDDVVDRAIDSLVEVLSAKPDVVALGIKVTRQAAARAALLRGVLELTKTTSTVSKSAEAVAPTQAEAPMGDVLLGGGPEAAVTTGGQTPPENWSLTLGPSAGVEVELHAWYTTRGWNRYVATTKRGMAILYWAPNALHRPLCADPFDPYVTVAPVVGYGLVHLVPQDWATQRGLADSAEQREAGTTPSLRASMGEGADGALPGKASVLRG